MYKKIKNNSGITLVALVLTVIIMTIIASIGVHEGRKIIKKSKIQTLQTSMLTIQAKAKAYSEEIEAKVWAIKTNQEKKRKDYFEEKGLENLTGSEYKVTQSGLQKMGLEDLEGEDYFTVIFSNNYESIDVKYSKSVNYEGKDLTLLSEIQRELEE